MRGICESPVLSGHDEKDAKVTDVSAYGDINDLLTVADVLVTDFSSVIFDYFLLDKPVVYFIYDRENYQENRGLYFDFKDYLYGEVTFDRRSLAAAIKAEKTCKGSRDAFKEKFVKACDGRSTERVIEWVFGGDNE